MGFKLSFVFYSALNSDGHICLVLLEPSPKSGDV